MSGDAGECQRILCVAQAINRAALSETEKVSGFNHGLLLGKSQAIRSAANPGGFGKIRSQGWKISDSENNAGARLKGNAAEEFPAEND